MRNRISESFCHRHVLAAMLAAGVLAPLPAHSVVINSSFTGFSAAQEDVIRAAAEQWTVILGGTQSINLNFTVDNSITALASTSGWVTDGTGRPTSANIAVRESAYNWTTGAPAAGQYDALRDMAHEIGHALGFAAGSLPNLAANIATTAGGQRYYDVDHSGTFSAAADFALGPPSAGTHAPGPPSAGDLMTPSPIAGVRQTPTLRHAAVLTDAFGYGTILYGFGGTAGYGSLAMTPNDDQSSSLLNLPFSLNFYGSNYSNFYINNNGNISFTGPVGTFTPQPFPVANQPMIAPYWGDVDTRCGGCGAVYVASPDSNTAIVTWDRVGYYNQHSNLTNTFQLVLRNRSDTGAGNFDIEFRYGNLSWTTGDASGGSGGVGGTPAQAGLDAGDSANFFTLPGSRTSAVLDLDDTTNLASPIEGVWSFAVRSGTPPGSTSDNPLQPVVTSNGWNFNFNIGPNTGRVFIDPVLAVGYDYVVNSGPNVQTVLLPVAIGDGVYDLWLWDPVLGRFVDSNIDIVGGNIYDFGLGGVDRFSIRGIEESAGLDPTNVTAFVTGLTFTDIGTVDLTMTPVVVDTDEPIPLPGTISLMSLAALGAALVRRRAGKALH